MMKSGIPISGEGKQLERVIPVAKFQLYFVVLRMCNIATSGESRFCFKNGVFTSGMHIDITEDT
ncbi:MAG: hypothetical protein ACM31E_10760 [Fibrobacterota bacterium]|nr:hypothetical protein [Chitinispirillaceae bacterium]